MERDQVLPIGAPKALAVPALVEKTHPGEDIVRISTHAVGRAHTDAWAFPEEPVEIEVVAAIVAEDERGAVDKVDAPACGAIRI